MTTAQVLLLTFDREVHLRPGPDDPLDGSVEIVSSLLWRGPAQVLWLEDALHVEDGGVTVRLDGIVTGLLQIRQFSH